MSFAPGGNMLEMSTRFVPAMPALRNAYSKLVSLSSCTPMPFVRKSFFATRSNKTFARKWINYLCLGTILNGTVRLHTHLIVCLMYKCNTRVYTIQKLGKCSKKATIDLFAFIEYCLQIMRSNAPCVI